MFLFLHLYQLISLSPGMWLMCKFKKNGSLQQLSLKDDPRELRNSFLYKLSEEKGIEIV